MTVAFKRPSLQREFNELLHPATRACLVEADHYLVSRGLPGILITRIATSDAEVISIYKKLRFTWHRKDKDGKVRAADFRNTDPKMGRPLWCHPDATDFEAWLRHNWPGYEILFHDVGRGKHGHLAVPSPWAMVKRLKRFLIRRKVSP